MKFTSRLPLALVSVGMASIVFACASLGTPHDQSLASSQWEAMNGYQQWATFDGWEGKQKGRSPHGKYIKIFMNSTAATNPANPPAGSIIVKENFSSKDASQYDSVTAMQKIAGYAPEAGDWLWTRFEPGGELTHAGKVTMCSDCHASAGGGDYVFVNDE